MLEVVSRRFGSLKSVICRLQVDIGGFRYRPRRHAFTASAVSSWTARAALRPARVAPMVDALGP